MNLTGFRWQTVVPGGLLGVQQRGQPDVVLGHDAVEHVVRALGVGHRQLRELHQVLLDQRELGGAVEDGAAVDELALALRHGLGARLGREDAVVAVHLELRQEEAVELVRLHLLQADDVGRVVADLVEDALLAVLPLQRPAGAVAVHLARRVLVAQHVVAHHREDARGPGAVGPGERDPRPLRRLRRRHL